MIKRACMQGMKEDVRANPDKSVKQVYQKALAESVSALRAKHPMEEIGAVLPTFENVSSILHRERASHRPPLPKSLADLVLSEDQTKTTDNQTFLIANDGTNDRILGFCADEALEILCSADTVFMDGTFKVAPTLFRQLYTLHGSFEGEMMALAYFLLPDKEKETYLRMFSLISDHAARRGLTFRPAKFQIDFESAVLGAIRVCFPAAEVKGCTFHFTQAVWRNVQRCGLQAYYKNDPEVKK